MTAFAGFAATSARAQAETVRVVLLAHRTQITFASGAGLVVRSQDDSGAAEPMEPQSPTVLDVRATAVGLLLGNAVAAPARLMIAAAKDAPLIIDGRAFRGTAIVQRDGVGTFRVINIIDMEQYLYGVVPAEMDAGWPAAALQAQAIVARTYALSRLGSHESDGFDVYAGERDQVYRGAALESQETTDAVDATRGLVLSYANRPVHAYYCSSDGGYTTDGSALGDLQPYLIAQRDPWEASQSSLHWTARLSLEALAAALKRKRWGDVGTIQTISPGTPDVSGRLQTVVFSGSAGGTAISGTSFRSLAGSRVVKSTRIDGLVIDQDNVVVNGSGSGHGVGMSQWGARDMAAGGHNAQDILSFYYRGTTLVRMDALPLAPASPAAPGHSR